MQRLTRITSTIIVHSMIAFVLSWQVVYAAPQTDTETLEQEPTSKATTESTVASEVGETGRTKPIDLEIVFTGKETPTTEHLLPMQEHFKKLIEKVRPATVGIRANNASGSGVIVSRDGYVLTAAHVIGGPEKPATIILQDGTELRATTLGLNHTIDSGMLKIIDPKKLPYLDLGESETLNEGQWVMAIGHPGGFDKERAPPIRIGRLISLADRENVLQSDCTLVGGDSGGPLVDMDGKVIGIHSRIGGRLNQNFHVPIDTYLINWDDMIAKVEIGGRSQARIAVRIGFSFDDETTLEISKVETDGPAEKAGVQVGDVVFKIEGRRIRNQRVLRRELIKMKPEQTVKLTVKRGEQELEFEVTVEKK